MAVTATVGGALIQGYTAYTSNEAGNRAEARQAKSAAKAEQMREEELHMQRERLAEWEATYGSIEDSMSSYYNNLDPDDYRLEQYEAEKVRLQDTRKQIQTMFGSEGNSGSAAEQLALTQNILTGAQNNARTDRDAESKINQEKAEFLNLGLNKKAGIQRDLGNSYTNGANFHQEQANLAQGQANQHNNTRDGAIGGLLSTGINYATGGGANPVTGAGYGGGTMSQDLQRQNYLDKGVR